MVNKTQQACVVLLAANSLLLNTSCRTWFETQSSEVLPPPADILLMAPDVSLMKGFCCANTMLSVLPQVDAVLMQVPLPKEVVWNLQSCGHWNLKFCNCSWHILLKVSAYHTYFRVTENQAELCHGGFFLVLHGFFSSASNN